ncbi:MAG: four helix bundle protein [Proteobacteria bacterium]|nr:four helix bundle protein [Pseudomonadota bacterium]
MELAREVYGLARQMPKQEEYRLTGQMIRAAVSIAANIAEGHARATRKDYAHFVSIARGSAAELETLVLLARDADLASVNATAGILERTERVAKMLTRPQARLKPAPDN